MAWLDDNPPASPQFRCPRRDAEQGVIVVHTAESVMDTVGVDTGAEAVARFIRDRPTPGSYHELVDSDSFLGLVRDECEAFHDGTGSNPWSWGLSFACSYLDWSKMSKTRRAAFIEQGARRAAAYAKRLRARTGIEIPAKRITRTQSEAGARGFISHAERDPARRKDPGNKPRQFPWAAFLARYDALVPWGSTPLPPVQEADLMLRIATVKGEPTATGNQPDVSAKYRVLSAKDRTGQAFDVEAWHLTGDEYDVWLFAGLDEAPEVVPAKVWATVGIPVHGGPFAQAGR